MSRLLIKQVKYIGANYIYESPILEKGVNILVGENGSGKTTFSSLVYFCLGGNVKWFKKDGKDDHNEITKDNSNYAELTFIIDEVTYTSTRFFYKNEISIVSSDDVLILPINRSKDKNHTFSDWLLQKLNIKVVDIYQGSEYYKINFYDLIRLFYYDQETATNKIYKRPDNENFITDSFLIIKAIFEILIGNSFDDYYKAIADYRKTLSEQSTLKALMQNFESLNIDTKNLFDGKNSFSLKEGLKELTSQLNRLEDYRESIKGNVDSSKSNTEVISSKRNQFSKVEESFLKHKRRKTDLLYDYNRVKRLHSNLILEVTHLKKIIQTNEQLNLFSPETSPETCPYCLKKSNRNIDECICGNEVTDEQFQKFFYTKEEYLNILKSKQKNIETVSNAIDSYEKEIDNIRHQLALHNKKISELKEINDKVFDLEKEINNLKQQIKIILLGVL